MKKILLLFGTVLFLTVNGQTPNWAWAKGVGGNLGQINSLNQSTCGNSVVTDASGNAYAVGYFQTSTMVVGNFTLTNVNSSGDKSEIFIVKYDATGNVLWAKSVRGDSSDIGTSITVDDASNIYITGDFASPSLTFDNKTVTNLNPGVDVFIAKYNSSGNIIWAKSWGASGDENGISIIKDAVSDIYITGNFKSQSFNIGGNTLTIDSLGKQDMYVAKFDSSGNPIYAKSVGENCYIPIISSDIVSDANNDIYITGSFRSSKIILGNDTLHCNSNSANFFLSKYDASGNILWAKSGKGLNYDVAMNSLAVGPDGNLYTTGNFAGNSMAIGSYTLSSACCYSGFVAKYSPAGNALWAKNMEDNNPQPWPIGCIAIDNNCGVYVGGGFINQVNALPPLVFGNDTLINGNPGMDAIFIAKYDSSGNPLWGKTASSTRWNVMMGIKTDKYDNIYCVGFYNSPAIIFNNDTLYNQNQGMWNADYFIAKIGTTGVGVEPLSPNYGISIYPNPTSGRFTVSSTDESPEIRITDVVGHVIYESKATGSLTNHSIERPGIYFVSVISGQKKYVSKLIVHN